MEKIMELKVYKGHIRNWNSLCEELSVDKNLSKKEREEAIILKAKILLKGTELPLSEVAAAVGILDQSYFTRKFKQHEGVTPSLYRKIK